MLARMLRTRPFGYIIPRLISPLVLLTGCAVPASVADAPQLTVVVDGRQVHAGERSLLQLLHCCTSTLRLGEGEGNVASGPLVFVDGVRVVGVLRLADIPAVQAERVEILRPLEALPIYGSRARNGAILVWSRADR